MLCLLQEKKKKKFKGPLDGPCSSQLKVALSAFTGKIVTGTGR